jgi:4-oxalocrotonate tautomerase
MPFVQLSVLGTLTIEQKREITKRITTVLKEVANKPPEYTHIVINEVPATNWGNDGALFSDE